MAGLLDHGLVGPSVDDEDEGVVVFDGLDGALSAQGVLDDSVLVPCLLLLHTLAFVLGLPVEGEGDGASEGDLGPHSVLSLGVGALLDGGGCSFGSSGGGGGL